MKTLLINTPELNNYNNPAVELKEKKLKKWLSDQPILNLVHSVPALIARLPLLNEEPINSSLRLKLLEVYYEPITSIFYSFDKSRLQQFPVSADIKLSITKGVGVLCQALATGYKLIIEQAFKTGKNHSKNKDLTLACFRGIEMLFLGLMHAYRTYSASPPFNLLELHQIFQFAEDNGFDSQLFACRNSDARISIRQLYTRAVLVTISDPFRLPEGGILRLNDFLQKHAGDCAIGPFSANNAEGLFLIDLGSDAAPHPCSRLPDNLEDFTDSPNSDLRTLNVIPLIEHVANKVNNPTESFDKELTLLNILLPNLQAVRQRRSAKRMSVEKQAHIATGIQSLKFFLRGNHATIKHQEDNYGIHVSDDEDEPHFALNLWKIKNEALRGYLLNCSSKCELLNVGQLLGVAQHISNPKAIPFTLTVVRWLHNNQQNILEIGVETMPGIPRIGKITLTNGTVCDCIQLDAILPLKLHATVILEKGLVQAGDILTLGYAITEQRIQVCKARECTDFFDAYHYEVVG